MSLFQPTRISSPRVRPVAVPDQFSDTQSTIQDSSMVSSPELASLTKDDIELIDTVIERAGPSATTFLTVFKAYNDVLTERGLDPHEVLYYGKLLKLGTIKGKNWGEKWNMVKAGLQNRGGRKESTPRARSQDKTRAMTDSRPKSVSKRASGRANEPLQSVENIESMTSWRTAASTLPDEPSSISQYKGRSSLDRGKRSTLLDSPAILDSRRKTRSFEPSLASPRGRLRRADTDTTTTTSEIPASTPPSYNAAAREAKTSILRRLREQPDPEPSSATSSMSEVATMLTRPTVTRATEEPEESVDPWKKIQMKKDEENADLFRADRLQERCYEVWKTGFQWIITTNRQVAEAHDNLLLRISLQKWRDKVESRQRFDRSAVAFHNAQCLTAFFRKWHHQLHEKKKVKWRDDMRRRMKTLQDKKHVRIQKEAWRLWRQAYLGHFADQHYERNLEARMYEQWKKHQAETLTLEHTADEFYHAQRFKDRERCFREWQRATQLRALEGTMAQRVHLRIYAMVWEKWRKRVNIYQAADDYRNASLLRSTLLKWKNTRQHLRKLEGRADKYRARQNLVLMIATARVWRAKQRGHLLENVKDARLLKRYLDMWRRKKQENEQRLVLAESFAQRPKSSLLVSSMARWRAAYTTHQNAAQFADQYHTAHVQYKSVLQWRIQLRNKYKLAKVARKADVIFATRRAWDKWLLVMGERDREKRVKEFETNKVEKVFRVWLEKAQKSKQLRTAESAVADRIKERLLNDALSRWTNRVIELKLRELEVVQEYNNNRLEAAYRKWKRVHKQHVEQVNLLESYELVKKEETLGRVFNHWLTQSRTNRDRRELLEQKEQEMKQKRLEWAWDMWREKFVEEKLLPLEQALVKQTTKNLMFRAFGGWYARTKTLPAIKLHNENVRYKHFAIWRAAMPKALQAKKAKEVFRRNVLARYLDRWLREYRSRMALKAVARARYLRLPAAPTPRPRPSLSNGSNGADSPRPSAAPSTTSSYPIIPLARGRSHQLPPVRTRDKSKSPDTASVASAPVLAPWKSRHRGSFIGRRGGGGGGSIADTSPTRSAFGGSATALETGSGPAGFGEDKAEERSGRGRLWNELRAVQRRSRPSSRA